jgi:tetratricopeptide (TPR) repeat protein
LGEIGTAREHVERGHSHDCAVGYYFVPYMYFSLMSEICFRSGDWEGARQYADDGLQRAKAASSRLGEARLITLLGRALAKLDPSQNVKVEGLILKSINMLEELRLKPYQAHSYLNLGELYADMGREEKALETLKKAKGMFREMGMDYYLARTEKALEKLKAS